MIFIKLARVKNFLHNFLSSMFLVEELKNWNFVDYILLGLLTETLIWIMRWRDCADVIAVPNQLTLSQ